MPASTRSGIASSSNRPNRKIPFSSSKYPMTCMIALRARVSSRKPVQTVASEAGTSSECRCSSASGSDVGEHHRQPSPDGTQQQ